MHVRLDSDQQAEMRERGHDIDEMLVMLVSEGRDANRESAFLAWSLHSDRSAASWLTMERADDVVSAHDSLVRDDLEKRIRDALRKIDRSDLIEFVKDRIESTSTDPEDPDLLSVVDIEGETPTSIGIMRMHDPSECGMVEAIADRLEVELPADFERSCGRPAFMDALDLRIEDGDGYPR